MSSTTTRSVSTDARLVPCITSRESEHPDLYLSLRGTQPAHGPTLLAMRNHGTVALPSLRPTRPHPPRCHLPHRPQRGTPRGRRGAHRPATGLPHTHGPRPSSAPPRRTAARVPGTERTAVRGHQHPLPMRRPRTPGPTRHRRLTPLRASRPAAGEPGRRRRPGGVRFPRPGCRRSPGRAGCRRRRTAVHRRQRQGAGVCSLARREQPIRPALLHQPRDWRRAGGEQRGQKIVRPT